jgi:hypothetical protein
MKKSIVLLALLAAGAMAQADIVQFDLSPRGTSPGVGLSPSNEVPPLALSGSGGETLLGVWFDTGTLMLNFSVGYGAAAGFSNLTGPATQWGIFGPAPVGGTAPVLFDLAAHQLPAGDPAMGGVLFGAVAFLPSQTNDLFQGLDYLNIATAANATGEIRGQLVPLLNTPPTVTCPEPVVLECNSPQGARATLTAQVADADGDTVQVVWYVDGVSRHTNTVAATATPTNVQFTALFSFGPHTVEVWATDGITTPVNCSTMVTVVDTKPPLIRLIRASPNQLWPPNHKMVPVTVRVDAVDACGGPVTNKIVSVASNEPANGTGDGNTPVDWAITGDLTLTLRAERAGTGNGRVYTITVASTDTHGNTSTGTVTVTVPKNQGGGR